MCEAKELNSSENFIGLFSLFLFKV